MVSLKFHDEEVKENFIEVEAYSDAKSLIVSITNGSNEDNSSHIFLNKMTAVKLSKELRKQIALLF